MRRTFGFMGRRSLKGVYAEKGGYPKRVIPKAEKAMKESTRIAALVLLIGSLTATRNALATVNVYFSGPQATQLQQNFLLDTTSQYQGLLSPSPYFANTYSLTLSQKNPPAPPAQSCDTDAELALTTATLSGLISNLQQHDTDYYLNGWVNGQSYERWENLVTIGNYGVSCTSSVFTAPPGVSTTTWKVPPIDNTTCKFVLGYINQIIYQKNFALPTQVPGF